ncbi:MAG: hypothetical protein ACRD1P_13635 [Thermoanaerobaculia bacterium]
MIVSSQARLPAVRPGEWELAGRRIAVRVFPCLGEAGQLPFRFDPLERRFMARKADGTVSVGPADAELWRSALARLPAGPALVGPGEEAEQIRAAYQAAAEGALRSGRAVYLLDPEPEGLPGEPKSACVALFCGVPGQRRAPASLSAAISRGIPSGCLLPLLPGWTSERTAVDGAVSAARDAGAQFLAPVLPAEDGRARRAIVQAAAALDPESADRLFDRVYHGDWSAELREGLLRVTEACARMGLASVPPRPVGLFEPAGNAAAAGRLEEKALALFEDEHRAALFHAAARWIDESGRDLAPIVREGNFRKVFPFGAELAAEAEEAFGGSNA